MKQALLVTDGVSNNVIFDRASPLNRDDCFEPYVVLRERFLARGIAFDTADLCRDDRAEFELHMNVRPPVTGAPPYAFLFEAPQIFPPNGVPANWKRYRKVFTWRDDLVDGERFIKLNFPNPLMVPAVDGWAQRPRFCCVIAGNKSAALGEGKELYTERVKAIRWFESHAPADFDLYGVGWDLPAPRPGLLGKVQMRLWRQLARLLPRHPFPSYRGKVGHKREILLHTRFSICYENVRDVPGYITEKLFDCFFSGCVPVYWGAGNITDHVPAGCFIDRRDFRDTAEVYRFLKAMTEETYCSYQAQIAAFLAGPDARPFGVDDFVNTIVNTVAADLGLPE